MNDEIFEAGMHVSLEIKTIIAELKTLCTEDCLHYSREYLDSKSALRVLYVLGTK